MKTLTPLLACLAGITLGGTAFAAKTPTSAPAALQLQVDLPFARDLFVEDDVRDALAYRVRDAFDRRGYTGGVETLSPGATAKTEKPVLSINLIRWQASRTGFIDCTFSAVLRNPDGTSQSLGVFTGTEMALNPRSRWDLARDYSKAAGEAADKLWQTLQKQSLLPTSEPAPAAAPSTPATTATSARIAVE